MGLEFPLCPFFGGVGAMVQGGMRQEASSLIILYSALECYRMKGAIYKGLILL